MISSVVAALADSALLLPASLIVASYLAALRQFRLAGAWCLALALSGLATVAAKLVFQACGHELTTYDVVSPSGHASFAAVFYGCLAIVFGTGRPRVVRYLIGLGTALFVLGVGVSRVRTGVHTRIEVVIGTMIGAAALAVFARLHGRIGRPTVPLLPVAIGFAALVLVAGGLHLNFEQRIGGVARRVSAALDVCARSDVAAGLRFPLAGE